MNFVSVCGGCSCWNEKNIKCASFNNFIIVYLPPIRTTSKEIERWF